MYHDRGFYTYHPTPTNELFQHLSEHFRVSKGLLPSLEPYYIVTGALVSVCAP